MTASTPRKASSSSPPPTGPTSSTPLLRPGRFDRQIVVDLPNLEGREAILKIHARKVKLDAAVQLRNIARGTPGFSGADLANLMNESALLAARRGAEAINEKDLEEARDKVRWGRERRSRVLDDKEKRMTACHEAGHAIVLALTEGTEPLHKVTIIPRGQALGATIQLPEKDKYTEGRKQLLGSDRRHHGRPRRRTALLRRNHHRAASDIRQATHIARMMVTEWGMSDLLGFQHFGNREEVLFLGPRSFPHQRHVRRHRPQDRRRGQAHPRRVLPEGRRNPHRQPRQARSAHRRPRRNANPSTGATSTTSSSTAASSPPPNATPRTPPAPAP
jgi:ATP-dependent Zn protease